MVWMVWMIHNDTYWYVTYSCIAFIAYCIAVHRGNVFFNLRKLAGPHGGSIAKAEKAANKCGFTLMDTNLGEIFRVPGVPGCNLCIFVLLNAFQEQWWNLLWGRLQSLEKSSICSSSTFAAQISMQSIFGSDWATASMPVMNGNCAFQSPNFLRNPGAWGDARTCLLQPFWGGKRRGVKDVGEMGRVGNVEILVSSRCHDVALEPFESESFQFRRCST